MRALTVRQPWAWAIAHGGKDVENRTRNVAGKYRGPVAIHAGLQWDRDGVTDLVVRAWSTSDSIDNDHHPKVFGAFVGVVDLVDVHTCRAEELEQVTVQCCSSPWAGFEFVEVRALSEAEPQRLGTVVHLVLANPRPLPTPIPARGMLGLWTPPPAVLEQLQAVTR